MSTQHQSRFSHKQIAANPCYETSSNGLHSPLYVPTLLDLPQASVNPVQTPVQPKTAYLMNVAKQNKYFEFLKYAFLYCSYISLSIGVSFTHFPYYYYDFTFFVFKLISNSLKTSPSIQNLSLISVLWKLHSSTLVSSFFDLQSENTHFD